MALASRGLSVDFFAKQETARRHTARLVLLFVAAVAGIIVAADLLATLGAWWLLDIRGLGRDFHLVLAGVILLAVFVFAVRRLVKLRDGGEAIARMVKARRVERNTKDPAERRLLNIVDEMAIASGLAAPSVFTMDGEEGINAFAAGYSPNQAVIVVTKGALAKLTRDELQGVIGHEFSHILNGDMRLNVRLIGILAGIVVVGEAGLVIIKLGAEAGDTGAIPFIAWGALVAAVGYIGVFFGRMIKAAVSRQREFLADASSVQFTRNPDGLVGALRKIHKDGKAVGNSFAGEMSHMYFSQAISPAMFADWLATHPPIDERIAGITGRKAAGGTPDSVVSSVGQSSPEHVERATELLGVMPEAVKRAIETPEGARQVVYAYLFAADEPTRVVQLRALGEAGDGAMAAGVAAMNAMLRKLGPEMRLPVLTLALPSLAQMDAGDRASFLAAVDALVDADHEVTLEEFTLRTIVRRHLAASSARLERVKYRDVKAVSTDVALLLATLARAGASDPAAQQAAYSRGMSKTGLQETFAAQGKLDAAAVSAALDRVRVLAPLAKPRVVEACVATALADGEIKVAEMELLRAIGMAIDCPLPPMLERDIRMTPEIPA